MAKQNQYEIEKVRSGTDGKWDNWRYNALCSQRQADRLKLDFQTRAILRNCYTLDDLAIRLSELPHIRESRLVGTKLPLVFLSRV